MKNRNIAAILLLLIFSINTHIYAQLNFVKFGQYYCKLGEPYPNRGCITPYSQDYLWASDIFDSCKTRIISPLTSNGITDSLVIETTAISNGIHTDSLFHGFWHINFAHIANKAGIVTAISVADCNNDGRKDIILGRNQAIEILFQNPNHTFTSQLYPIQNTTNERIYLVVGNLNADKLTDIAYYQSPSTFLTVLYQTTNKQFQSIAYDCPITQGSFNYQLEIADLNNDQLDDLLLLKNDALALYNQTPAGQLLSYQLLPQNKVENQLDLDLDSITLSVKSFAIGDLNNDYRNDILKVYDNTISFSYQDSITHQFPESTTIKIRSVRTKIADINNDLINEIISFGNPSLTVLQQSPSGKYTTAFNDTLPIWGNNLFNVICLGDVNNDNKTDIFIPVGEGTISFLNKSKMKKPSAARGQQKICDSKTYTYINPIKTNQPLTWRIIPSNAATIQSISADTAHISWNPTFQGHARLQWSIITNCDTITGDTLFITKELNTPQSELPESTILCKGDSLLLSARVPRSSYHWQDNSHDSTLLIHQPGTYSVTITNACGTLPKSILVDGCDLDVPTAFSPNADNINDQLHVLGRNVNNISFTLYNRWGETIFHSTSLTETWDGTLNGQPLPPTVFTYTLTGHSLADGHLLQKQGTITLIR